MGENMPLVSKGDEPESVPNRGLAFRMDVVGERRRVSETSATLREKCSLNYHVL